MSKRNIIFFDAETNREKSIVDLGALSWADGAIFHAARIAGLQQFVRDHGGESALIAGHNVCDFDIPIVAPLTDFASRHLIDTLYLSAVIPKSTEFTMLSNSMVDSASSCIMQSRNRPAIRHERKRKRFGIRSSEQAWLVRSPPR